MRELRDATLPRTIDSTVPNMQNKEETEGEECAKIKWQGLKDIHSDSGTSKNGRRRSQRDYAQLTY